MEFSKTTVISGAFMRLLELHLLRMEKNFFEEKQDVKE